MCISHATELWNIWRKLMDVAGYKDKSIVRGGEFKTSHITIDRKAR